MAEGPFSGSLKAIVIIIAGVYCTSAMYLLTMLNGLFNTFMSLTLLNNPRMYVLLQSLFKMEAQRVCEKGQLLHCFLVGRASSPRGMAP